jgi:hypothetical protein
MDYEIAVITKVPTDRIAGNLALPPELYWDTQEMDEKTYLTKVVPLVEGLAEHVGPQAAGGIYLSMRAPVFQLGEILFLDEGGREVTTAMGGRKPSKWMVETTTVDTLDEALALSDRVCNPEKYEEDEAIASIKNALNNQAEEAKE